MLVIYHTVVQPIIRLANQITLCLSVGSSFSTGGGATDTFALGPWVKYPALVGVPAKNAIYIYIYIFLNWTGNKYSNFNFENNLITMLHSYLGSYSC